MDLETLIEAYKQAQRRSKGLERDLYLAVLDVLAEGHRGDASAIARMLGWDRRRLAYWLSSCAKRFAD